MRATRPPPGFQSVIHATATAPSTNGHADHARPPASDGQWANPFSSLDSAARHGARWNRFHRCIAAPFRTMVQKTRMLRNAPGLRPSRVNRSIRHDAGHRRACTPRCCLDEAESGNTHPESRNALEFKPLSYGRPWSAVQLKQGVSRSEKRNTDFLSMSSNPLPSIHLVGSPPGPDSATEPSCNSKSSPSSPARPSTRR
jgi:hypothetical protein